MQSAAEIHKQKEGVASSLLAQLAKQTEASGDTAIGDGTGDEEDGHRREEHGNVGDVGDEEDGDRRDEHDNVAEGGDEEGTNNDDNDTKNGNNNDGNQESDVNDGLNEHVQGYVGSGQKQREPQEGKLEEQDMWVPSDRDGTFREDVGGDECDDWPSDISSNDEQARTRLEILRNKLTRNDVKILPVSSAEMDALVQRISNPGAAVDPAMLSGDFGYYLRMYDAPKSPPMPKPPS